VAAIQKTTGIELDKKYIDLPAHIKEIGLHEVTIRPHPDVEFPLSLDIIPS